MNRNKRIIFFSLFIILFISACVFQVNSPKPTPDFASTGTVSAQTVEAQLAATEDKQSPTPLPPTATPLPTAEDTSTSIPTNTPFTSDFVTPYISNLTPSPTPVTLVTFIYPTPIPTSTAPLMGDHGIFIDQDPPNGTVFARNTSFNMTWTFKNIGTTTWNTNYFVTLFGGSRLGDGPNSYFLTKALKPNENGLISVKMTSPSQTGSYTSIWFLMNDQQQAILELTITINVQ